MEEPNEGSTRIQKWTYCSEVFDFLKMNWKDPSGTNALWKFNFRLIFIHLRFQTICLDPVQKSRLRRSSSIPHSSETQSLCLFFMLLNRFRFECKQRVHVFRKNCFDFFNLQNYSFSLSEKIIKLCLYIFSLKILPNHHINRSLYRICDYNESISLGRVHSCIKGNESPPRQDNPDKRNTVKLH